MKDHAGSNRVPGFGPAIPTHDTGTLEKHVGVA